MCGSEDISFFYCKQVSIEILNLDRYFQSKICISMNVTFVIYVKLVLLLTRKCSMFLNSSCL